jgi:hypothetical protein
VRLHELLLRLTIIERLARGELPEMEQAGLPPEAHPELIKRLAEETANEHQREMRVVH